MGVSENRGTPKSSIFNRVFHYFHHPFWGIPIFGNPQILHTWQFYVFRTKRWDFWQVVVLWAWWFLLIPIRIHWLKWILNFQYIKKGTNIIWGFPKIVVPPTTIGFPTKNDHFGVFWGYHHLRKHPYIQYHVRCNILIRLQYHVVVVCCFFNPPKTRGLDVYSRVRWKLLSIPGCLNIGDHLHCFGLPET